MSADGCQQPTWTGQAFSYLMHHPTSSTERLVTVESSVDVSPAPGAQATAAAGAGPGPEAESATERQSDTVTLPGGVRMPLIGFGTYKVDSTEAVRNALDAGYRHLDCAPVYFNEALVGGAIKPWLEQHGRHSLFLTSKIWNDAHRPQLVRESVHQTLAALGVQQLDLLLMHWPDAWVPGSAKEPDNTVTIYETCFDETPQRRWRHLTRPEQLSVKHADIPCWTHLRRLIRRAMEALVDEGATKMLGVSNFGERELGLLLEAARIRPVVNQVELHPLLAQRRLVGWCSRKEKRQQHAVAALLFMESSIDDSVCIMCLRDGSWGTAAHGGRTENSHISSITCVAYGPLGHSKTDLLAHPGVTAIAQEAGRSPAQVLLRWNVQRGVAVLPKASSQGHMVDNIQGLFDWRLTYDQKACLDAMNQGQRYVDNDWHDFEE